MPITVQHQPSLAKIGRLAYHAGRGQRRERDQEFENRQYETALRDQQLRDRMDQSDRQQRVRIDAQAERDARVEEAYLGREQFRQEGNVEQMRLGEEMRGQREQEAENRAMAPIRSALKRDLDAGKLSEEEAARALDDAMVKYRSQGRLGLNEPEEEEPEFPEGQGIGETWTDNGILVTRNDDGNVKKIGEVPNAEAAEAAEATARAANTKKRETLVNSHYDRRMDALERARPMVKGADDKMVKQVPTAQMTEGESMRALIKAKDDAFKEWYAPRQRTYGFPTNPDKGEYDYKAAWEMGYEPDEKTGELPEQFRKKEKAPPAPVMNELGELKTTLEAMAVRGDTGEEFIRLRAKYLKMVE